MSEVSVPIPDTVIVEPLLSWAPIRTPTETAPPPLRPVRSRNPVHSTGCSCRIPKQPEVQPSPPPDPVMSMLLAPETMASMSTPTEPACDEGDAVPVSTTSETVPNTKSETIATPM